MTTIAQPTPNNTEHPNVEPVEPKKESIFDADSLGKSYNACKMGQKLNRYLIAELAENATQAMFDWLRSINAPDEVMDLYNTATMLLPIEQQLFDGKELSALDGVNALDHLVIGCNALEVVGGRIGNFNLPGTLPKFTLQVVETEAIPA